MSPIDKQQFRNQTDGWIGAVAIGPKGDDRGVAVEPGGTVWLSEAEQVLTANAPRRPQDNPFIEQTLVRTNQETGSQEEYAIVPLVPVDEDRWVPAQERFVPGMMPDARSGAVAQQAATGDEPELVSAVDLGAHQRHAEVAEAGEDALPNHRTSPAALAPDVPPRAAAAAAAAAASAAPEPTPPIEEEHAVKVDQAVGEETGAAPAPTGPAPEGEYAMAEEVGTPTAPEASEETSEEQSAPAPYVPPQE
jgi:hypothetical protein